jgi:hypothetical protein
MWPFRKRKYRREGGRGGLVTFVEGSRTGEMAWEMLTGEAHMVIYATECQWTGDVPRPMTDDEVRTAVQEYANEDRINIELAFRNHTEDIRPER